MSTSIEDSASTSFDGFMLLTNGHTAEAAPKAVTVAAVNKRKVAPRALFARAMPRGRLRVIRHMSYPSGKRNRARAYHHRVCGGSGNADRPRIPKLSGVYNTAPKTGRRPETRQNAALRTALRPNAGSRSPAATRWVPAFPLNRAKGINISS